MFQLTPLLVSKVVRLSNGNTHCSSFLLYTCLALWYFHPTLGMVSLLTFTKINLALPSHLSVIFSYTSHFVQHLIIVGETKSCFYEDLQDEENSVCHQLLFIWLCLSYVSVPNRHYKCPRFVNSFLFFCLSDDTWFWIYIQHCPFVMPIVQKGWDNGILNLSSFKQPTDCDLIFTGYKSANFNGAVQFIPTKVVALVIHCVCKEDLKL